MVTPTGAGTTLRYDLGGQLWQVVQGANTTRFVYVVQHIQNINLYDNFLSKIITNFYGVF